MWSECEPRLRVHQRFHGMTGISGIWNGSTLAIAQAVFNFLLHIYLSLCQKSSHNSPGVTTLSSRHSSTKILMQVKKPWGCVGITHQELGGLQRLFLQFPPQHLNRGKEAGEIQMYSSAGLQAFLAMLVLDLLSPWRKIKIFKQKILKKILVPSFFILASHEVHRKDLHVTGKAFAYYWILSFLVSQKPRVLTKFGEGRESDWLHPLFSLLL